MHPTRDPRAFTPKHLAEKILRSRPALEGERKHVTVLFADVKGSMDLAERMDPEEWSKIMNRFFQILSAGVERFEGFVDKFAGDGIMALFGAPVAHEDHAQRACYAALHLRDEIRRYADALRLSRGIDFSVRVGINSGEVVVGRIGDDLRMEYTAQGHTVGMAQRMEQLAAAHAIYLGESTAKLVSGYLELRDLGTSSVKGASAPVHVFELVGRGTHQTRRTSTSCVPSWRASGAISQLASASCTRPTASSPRSARRGMRSGWRKSWRVHREELQPGSPRRAGGEDVELIARSRRIDLFSVSGFPSSGVEKSLQTACK